MNFSGRFPVKVQRPLGGHRSTCMVYDETRSFVAFLTEEDDKKALALMGHRPKVYLWATIGGGILQIDFARPAPRQDW